MHRISRAGQKACVECQKRKSRCTGTTPCSYCSKAGKKCVYEAPPSRTPLTRRNLDEAERRCEQLTAVLRSLHPDIDLESVLRQSTRSGKRPVEETEFSRKLSHDDNLEEPSDEYEWDEAPLSSLKDASKGPAQLGDGMALLPTKRGESGYLGSSSGSHLLNAVSSLLPDKGDRLFDTPSELRPGSQMARAGGGSANFQMLDDLATTAVMERLIDAYFTSYNTSYPILHQRTFRAKYHTPTSIRPRTSSQMIFCMVLAIGSWVLSPEIEHEDCPYYHAARSGMSIRMLESGSVDTVQALSLMGNYLQKRDRPNTAYNLIGLASRMALGLGMHREVSDSSPDTLARERRRHIWWVLYCFDSGFSITTGRPITANDTSIDVSMPRNFDDTEADYDTPLANPVLYPTTNSAIIAQAALAMLANKIHSTILYANTRQRELDHHTALVMDSELAQWRSSIPYYFFTSEVPSWFFGPRAVVLWKEQNLRIMLWRGSERFQMSGQEKLDAAIRLRSAAMETVYSITTFCREHAENMHQGLSWYATYFLFQATLALDIHYLRQKRMQTDLGDETTWSESIAQARSCLAQLGVTNAAAGRCLSVLDRIHNHFAASRGGTATPSAALETSAAHKVGPHAGWTTTRSLQEPFADSNHWPSVADPSLYMFLNDATMPALLEGVDGYPSTQEHNYFDYVSGNLYADNDAQSWRNASGFN